MDQHTFIIGIDTHIKCSNHIVSKHTKVVFRIGVRIIKIKGERNEKNIFLIGILVLLMFPIQVYAEENTNINEEAENEKNQENEKDDNDQNYEIISM